MPEISHLYPNAIDSDTSLLKTTDRAETLITAAITDITLTIPVVSTSLFPDSGYLSIEDEILYYSSKTATQFNVTLRGAQLTSAHTHPINSIIQLNVIAKHHNILKDVIIAIETELGTNVSGSYTNLGQRLEVLVRDFMIIEDITSQVDNTREVFILSNEYYAGTLKVWINGLKEAVTELTSTTFRMSPAPEVGDTLEVEYVKKV
jgi:hypothetical protein